MSNQLTRNRERAANFRKGITISAADTTHESSVSSMVERLAKRLRINGQHKRCFDTKVLLGSAAEAVRLFLCCQEPYLAES